MAFRKEMLFLLFLSRFWIFSSAPEDQVEVKVKPGEDATLQCRGPRDAAITVLEWIRPDLMSALMSGYVFFYRDEHLVESFQYPSYVGRVQLRDPEMKDGDVSVILKNVSISDTGRYESRIMTREDKHRDIGVTCVIDLKVENAPAQATGAGNSHRRVGWVSPLVTLAVIFVIRYT